MKRLCLLMAMLLVVSRLTAQQINIDTNSDPVAGQFALNPVFFEPLGQSFTAITENVEWIGMFVGNCPSPIEFQITLLEGSGTSGTIVTTKTATAPSRLYGFLYFPFRGTPFVVGSQYTALFSQVTPTPFDCAGTQINGVDASVYSGGTAFISGQPLVNGDYYLRVLTAIFDAQVRPPLKPDGSFTFKRGRVVPVRFTLSSDGAPTCQLPPAKISLALNTKPLTPIFQAPFRINDCHYAYRLPTAPLPPGQYVIVISLTDSTPTPLQVGSVLFTVD